MIALTFTPNLDRALQRLSIFKDLHPIRFWTIVAVMLLVFFLLLFWFYQMGKRRQKIRDAKRNSYPTQADHTKRPWFKHPFVRWYLPLIVVFSGIIVSTVLYYEDQVLHTVGPIHENLAISQSPHIFGIDISHYQGRIDWTELRKTEHPLKYIFIRATMGTNGKDAYFKYNWKHAQEHHFLRGAYHYYRPNENSTKQFDNFKKTVKISPGDLPPVLDVEVYSKYGAENLRRGVLNWLRLCEEHYGIKPIVYAGSDFYNTLLRGHLDDYIIWIADYTPPHRRLNHIPWNFHQFTERVRIKGIATPVDGNRFNGSLADLYKLIHAPTIENEVAIEEVRR